MPSACGAMGGMQTEMKNTTAQPRNGGRLCKILKRFCSVFYSTHAAQAITVLYCGTPWISPGMNDLGSSANGAYSAV